MHVLYVKSENFTKKKITEVITLVSKTCHYRNHRSELISRKTNLEP